MKIDKKHIDQIKKQFEELKSKDDLAKLLSYVNSLLYGEKCKTVKLNSLTYYANHALSKNRYQTFTIKKKSGEDRIIHAPNKTLKFILRSLNLVLNCIYNPHDAATGFVNGKSIVDNAKKHVENNYVLNLDLKDFFHSFDIRRVKLALMSEPFNLRGDKEPIAFLIASLCTHSIDINGEVKMVLPQGSPTSPTLTNIICRKLDHRLNGLANRFGLIYTRYADDITFSSRHNVYSNEEFQKEMKRIIEEDQKLFINPKKERLQKKAYRMEVTGLVVNKKVNVRRRYLKKIRMYLYYWEKYGKEKAEEIFKKDYFNDKGHVKKGDISFIKVLKGKLEFLKMVKGEKDETYIKLKERFDKLNGEKNKQTNQNLSSNNEQKHTEKHIDNDRFHEPKKTVDLLKYFSANDKNLKYTTHTWEPGKYESYNDFYNKIKKEWKEIKSELKKQNEKLYAKINNFLFNEHLGKKEENKKYKESWGEKKLNFGWSSPELKMFMNENPKSDPFSFAIPENIRNLDKNYNLHYFKDYVEVFKNEIEFREDSKNFRKLIVELWKDKLGYDFEIKGIEELEGFSFYTDVHWVKEAIGIIFEMFAKQEFRHYNKILLERKSNLKNNPHHIIRITQIDSFVKRNVNDPKFKNPTGDLGNIINYLKNLCDYSIVSKFAEGNNNYECYRINYLISDKEKEFIKKLSCDDRVKGFAHELKFYL